MRVAAPTTPANYFHLLRRQTAGHFRKPLVVVGPKTLLRHKACVSSLSHMAEGTAFEPVLVSAAADAPLSAPEDMHEATSKGAKRVIICSGKIAVELEAKRAELAASAPDSEAASTAIVRVEELAPWPKEALGGALEALSAGEEIKSVRFVQEEPANAGTW